MKFLPLKHTIWFAFGSTVGGIIASYVGSYIWYEFDPAFPSPDDRFLVSLIVAGFLIVIGSLLFTIGLVATKHFGKRAIPRLYYGIPAMIGGFIYPILGLFLSMMNGDGWVYLIAIFLSPLLIALLIAFTLPGASEAE